MASLASQTYTPEEQTEIQKWTSTVDKLKQAAIANRSDLLDSLNSHLSTRTTILGSKPSTADVVLYETVAPLVKSWSPEERSGEHGRPHIVRLVDFVQNAQNVYDVRLPTEEKIVVDPEDVRFVHVVDAKAEKERLKKEKEAAATGKEGGKEASMADRTLGKAQDTVDKVKNKVVAAKDKVAATAGVKGDKPQKEKKERQPKQQKTPASAAPLSPSLIDLRVGHILKAIKHPEADSLYVSTIAMGDVPGEDTIEYEGKICRIVCSGLNGLVPLEDMQGRKVVVVGNLKPVKMRGVKSCAMVLAASRRIAEDEVDDHKGPVELLSPPEGAVAGDRVWFEGWEGEPEGILNPKKKVWETIQPGFTTTETCQAAFDASAVKELAKEGTGKLVTKNGGVCTVPTLAKARIG